MDVENSKAPEIYAEIDYLWTAMKAAQEESIKLTDAYAVNKRDADALKSRLAHLENGLREGAKREQALKEEISSLKGKLDRDAATLKEALASAREARRLQEEVNSFRNLMAETENLHALKESRLETLSERLRGAGERLAEKEKLIGELSGKINGLKALPEISAALLRDSAAAGREPAVFEDLLARLGSEAARNAGLSDELAKIKAEAESAGEKNRGLEKIKDGLETELELQKRKVQALSAELGQSAGRLEISAREKRKFEQDLGALTAARADLEEKLSAMALEREKLQKEMSGKDARIADLALSLQNAALKTGEQKQNFTGAVRTVFDLQSNLANLRGTLKQSRLDNDELTGALETKKAETEKLNALIREGSADVRQEREINKRSLVKIKALENEAQTLKARIAGAEEYAGSILKKLEEREKYVDTLKKELAKIPALEVEADKLKKHNLTLSGFIRTEQAEFTGKIVRSFSKIAGDLKLFNVRLSAVQAKHLSPTLKNLYGEVNLLKAWQTYMEEGEFEKEDADLKQLVSDTLVPWEKAFNGKKLGFAAYIGATRARSNISPEKIKMALYQLIKNAYENLPPGSSLKVVFGLSGDGKYASIKFDDTGPGLPQSVLERLFAPFNTSKKDRVGLGLALVNRIARLHGGEFAAANKKDRGLLAELRLPLSDEHGEPPLK
ncbi:MAG: hypothetical protein KKH28_12570 [Elusimicrobia bacterium]|nr:hypothetical protein [Elusimicrobiota bacterium]